MGVSLVIPTLNEAENLRLLMPRIPSSVTETIVVDAYSRDDTVRIAQSHGAKVVLSGARKGAAIRLGLDAATQDVVITMDADCSQAPDELDRYVSGVRDGYDIVFGSRFLRDGGSEDLTPIRHLGNGFFRFLVNRLWKTGYSDVCYGYMGFKRSILSVLDLKADGFDIEIEIKIKAAKKRLKILQVPSFEKRRAFGRGKLRTLRDGWIIFSRILRELWS